MQISIYAQTNINMFKYVYTKKKYVRTNKIRPNVYSQNKFIRTNTYVRSGKCIYALINALNQVYTHKSDVCLLKHT